MLDEAMQFVEAVAWLDRAKRDGVGFVPVRQSVTAPVPDHPSNTVTAPEHLQDGYWDDEFERQWHYEVKGG